MATNSHQEGDGPHDGQARGLPTRWLVAGLGVAWLVRTALRAKRRYVPSPVAVEVGTLDKPPEKPRRGHEHKDANAAWIFASIAFLLISVLCIHFIIAGFLGALKRTTPPSDRWRPAQQAARPVTQPGSFPVLQVSAPAELKAFRDRENTELNSYGWVNEKAGIVRVPIERAMDLVMQEGLPVRVGTNANRVGPSPVQLIQQRVDHRQPEIKGER